jgi:hypothetical protein
MHSLTGLSKATSNGVGTAFVGQTAKTSYGIYLVPAEGGDMWTVAEAGKADFTYVTSPALEGLNVAFAGTRGGLDGIFYAANNAAPHTLVNASRPQPHASSKGATLRCLEEPSVSSAGVVAFFGSDCASSGKPAGGPRPPMRDVDRMYRSRRVSEHAIRTTEEGVVAGIYLATLPTKGAAWPAAGEAALLLVADYNTEAPTSSGATFVGFSKPVAGDETIGFIGATSDGQLGVFTYSLTDQKLSKVVDTTSAVPGTSGTLFSDFPYAPSVHGKTTVFYAQAGSTASGLYAQTLSSHGLSNHSSKPSSTSVGAGSQPEPHLSALITMGDTLGDEQIAFIGAGSAATDGTSVAFYAVTSTNGIYVAPIGGSTDVHEHMVA